MKRNVCDRCEKLIPDRKSHLLRTAEIRTMALLRPNAQNPFVIEYDLCPACKDLFLDFMEGEAIPCRTKDAGS